MFSLVTSKGNGYFVIASVAGSGFRVERSHGPDYFGPVGLAIGRERFRNLLRYWSTDAWKLPCGLQDGLGQELDAARECYPDCGGSYELYEFDRERVYEELRGEDDFSSCLSFRSELA